MTKEEKELLLKDLSARLPYGVKAYVRYWSKSDWKYYEKVYTVKSAFPSLNEVHVQSKTGSHDVLLSHSDYVIKPYLFPLSSMTEEHIFEINNILGKDFEIDKYGITDLIRNRRTCLSYLELDALFEYFNKYHFDYRGLIPKGLANDATNLNIY